MGRKFKVTKGSAIAGIPVINASKALQAFSVTGPSLFPLKAA
jgi:hypothetical protein